MKLTRLHHIFRVWAHHLPARGIQHEYFLPGVDPRTSDPWFEEAAHITPGKARAVAEGLLDYLAQHPESTGLRQRLREDTCILARLDVSAFSRPDAPVPPVVPKDPLNHLDDWIVTVSNDKELRDLPAGSVLPGRGEPPGNFIDWVGETAEQEGILELTVAALLAPEGTDNLEAFKPAEGSGLLPVSPGQYIRIHARASFECRIYAFWVTPQGRLQRLFPWNPDPAKNFSFETGSDDPRREIKIPPSRYWRFEKACGLETLVVCAIRTKEPEKLRKELQRLCTSRDLLYPVAEVIDGCYLDHFDVLDARPGVMHRLDAGPNPPLPPRPPPPPLPNPVPPEVRGRHDRIRAVMRNYQFVTACLSFGNRGET